MYIPSIANLNYDFNSLLSSIKKSYLILVDPSAKFNQHLFFFFCRRCLFFPSGSLPICNCLPSPSVFSKEANCHACFLGAECSKGSIWNKQFSVFLEALPDCEKLKHIAVFPQGLHSMPGLKKVEKEGYKNEKLNVIIFYLLSTNINVLILLWSKTNRYEYKTTSLALNQSSQSEHRDITTNYTENIIQNLYLTNFVWDLSYYCIIQR